MRSLLLMLSLMAMSSALFAQTPPIEPGVSQELARWRAARYSDVRYKLDLTLEKMSPVLKGTIEIRVKVSEPPASAGGQKDSGKVPPIILDWRRIKGHEEKSTISNVTVNGRIALFDRPQHVKDGISRYYAEVSEHLVFYDNLVPGENVIKLDFTSPILTSGSAITRYVDKEDGSEYIYSLFVPSDASTAFPVFDQPDLKARFSLFVTLKNLVARNVVSNTQKLGEYVGRNGIHSVEFAETLPISSYVFAFAVGNFVEYFEHGSNGDKISRTDYKDGTSFVYEPRKSDRRIYVRESQQQKFHPHADDVSRLNREAIKYFEQYFDYKFPFPKYDLVLIPEFPFGGMEHAGATFLRESAIIFPQEPTKNDHISRATLIFHEAAHQWFGDTVTMRWFDDLWLKEGFATFTAYKAMEKIMPEMNAWKVFYERIKQGAYQTDSTRGTTAIYQPIANLSAAKSAYGNIVYNKAPAFLRQAEFYLGEDKFQTAVRAFLKKHEFGNAGWEDLVKEFANVKIAEIKTSGYYRDLSERDRIELEKFKQWSISSEWAEFWVQQRGTAVYRISPEILSDDIPFGFRLKLGETGGHTFFNKTFSQQSTVPESNYNWLQNVKVLKMYDDGSRDEDVAEIGSRRYAALPDAESKRREYTFSPNVGKQDQSPPSPKRKGIFVFPNYGDYGYGIFLLDEKSREYVLKNIQNEKDPFLRAMMWGALWDSVREGELDPRVFVELVVKVLSAQSGITTPSAQSGGHRPPNAEGSEDESNVATLLGRTGTALNYYMSEPGAVATGFPTPGTAKNPVATAPGSDMNDLRTRVEDLLIERMQNAPSLGQRITYYRAFLNIAASKKARGVLKQLLATGGNLSGSEGVSSAKGDTLPTGRVSVSSPAASLPLKTKDKFDIVTRLLILGDPEAMKLLADLERTETSDDAKRYAYAARAGIGTAENKAKYWNDFVSNKDISESWIEAAFGPWNSIRHSELTLPYLQKALQELPNHKRNRKIFFVNGWLGAFIGGQRGEEALGIVNKFLADNPKLDNDLRLKILENVDVIERAVRIRGKN